MISTVKELLSACLNKAACEKTDFNNPEIIKFSFAIIMWHVILVDNKITDKEIKNLFRYYQGEFGLKEDEIETILSEVKANTDLIELHIQHIEDQLKHDIQAKAQFLQHINALILCDGIVDTEYRVFEKIRDSFI